MKLLQAGILGFWINVGSCERRSTFLGYRAAVSARQLKDVIAAIKAIYSRACWNQK
jgi:hypothetical protein